MTAHFFEIANAIERWRQVVEVRRFLDNLPGDARKELADVHRNLQEIGHRVVAHSRNRTFHYPVPSGQFPTDEELRTALENLGTAEAQWVVEGDGRFRLKFADDVALALALGRHDPSRIERQLQLARDGSVAFVNFATRAMEVYLGSRGFSLPGR